MAVPTETPVATPASSDAFATTSTQTERPDGAQTSAPANAGGQISDAPIKITIGVTTGGSSQVAVDTSGGGTATSSSLGGPGLGQSSPAGTQNAASSTVEAGGTVVEVVVELDLAPAGNPIVVGTGTSLPGAAPPRPRETPFPPVAVGAGPGDARRDQELFGSRGCSSCHSIGTNTIVGPGLAGVADRAGAEAYLTESIPNPAVFIVPGFANDMPPFSTLTDQQLNDLIEYLKTLK